MASAMCHQLYNLQALETPLPGTTDVALAQAEEMATKLGKQHQQEKRGALGTWGKVYFWPNALQSLFMHLLRTALFKDCPRKGYSKTYIASNKSPGVPSCLFSSSKWYGFPNLCQTGYKKSRSLFLALVHADHI